MNKTMLVDASHPEETRVAIVHNGRLEEFDYETSTKRQIKSNIYLAKIIRIEPSLQAAFVEYGGNRHGFLSFSEIHPDYFQIPIDDRRKLFEEQKAQAQADDFLDDDVAETKDASATQEAPAPMSADGQEEAISLDLIFDEADEKPEASDDFEERPKTFHFHKMYKIQEVIKKRQILLVQIMKEERGNKGAALTTYMSLAGRYCVLMPNSGRGPAVSRKITDSKDRKRLKSLLREIELPENVGVIVRTAGMERNKIEIKRDLDYLLRLWDDVRELTLKSTAPALILSEGNLIKRTIRDMYAKDIDDIIVEGNEGFKTARDFLKMYMPSHAKKVMEFKESAISLFHKHGIEQQIGDMHLPSVKLKSGGSIVIAPTEALVSIDVNSGRSTRERHIMETALKTNLEAADEIARQMRLRDLGGLVVIDFIDMDDSRHNHLVEKRLREAIRMDRARIQIGHISQFGLLELSRQRLRPSLMEASSSLCPHCHGSGMIRSTESAALQILRTLEEEAGKSIASEVLLTLPQPIVLYLLNQKRASLSMLEERSQMKVLIQSDDTLVPPDFKLERTKLRSKEAAEVEGGAEEPVHTSMDESNDEERPSRNRRRRRRGGRNGNDSPTRGPGIEDSAGEEPSESPDVEASADDDSEETPRAPQNIRTSESGEGEFKRKRRRRRRNRPLNGEPRQDASTPRESSPEGGSNRPTDDSITIDIQLVERDTPKEPTRREPRAKAPPRAPRSAPKEASKDVSDAAPVDKPEAAPKTPAPKVSKPKTRTRKADKIEAPAHAASEAADDPDSKRRGWWQRLLES